MSLHPTGSARAVVIAAGRGSRLGEHTDDVPKCLVPVSGERTILEVQLDGYRAAGVREVVVVRGWRAEALEARRAALGPGVTFVENREWAHNNILESLFCAGEALDRPVLLSYGDIVFARRVVADLQAAAGDVCLVIDRDFREVYRGRTEHPLEQAEVADLDAEGRVRRVGKRALPPEGAWGEFIGLAKLSAEGARWFREAWAELRERYRGREQEPFQRAPSFRQAYLTDLLQHLIEQGRPVTPVPIRGGWREIDTAQDLERARALLKSEVEDWR